MQIPNAFLVSLARSNRQATPTNTEAVFDIPPSIIPVLSPIQATENRHAAPTGASVNTSFIWPSFFNAGVSQAGQNNTLEFESGIWRFIFHFRTRTDFSSAAAAWAVIGLRNHFNQDTDILAHFAQANVPQHTVFDFLLHAGGGANRWRFRHEHFGTGAGETGQTQVVVIGHKLA